MIDHPLFPPVREHEDSPDVGYIAVTRHTGGRQLWAPRLFEAAELTSLEQVAHLYGGGDYELVGRDTANQRIVARRKYSLEGAPKPLSPEQSAPQPMPAQQAPQLLAAGGSEQLLAMMMQMLQSQTAMAQAQMQQTTQILLAVLERGEEGSRAHVQSMQALHDRFAQSQAEIFGKVLEMRSAPASGDSDGFTKGVEFATEFVAGQRDALEEGKGDDVFDTLKQFAEGLGAFRGTAGAPPAPPDNQPGD